MKKVSTRTRRHIFELAQHEEPIPENSTEDDVLTCGPHLIDSVGHPVDGRRVRHTGMRACRFLRLSASARSSHRRATPSSCR